MIVVGCSASKPLARKIAKNLGCKYMDFKVSHFPDGETYLRFLRSVEGEILVLVQSLAKNPNENLTELLFAAFTLKELNAKKVIAVIPYLAYMRQDKRFKPGECVSSRAVAKLLEAAGIDEIFVVNPHLHRYKNLSDIFSIPAHEITVADKVADYIKNKIGIKNTTIIGPDIESYYRLVDRVVRKTKCKFFIFKKQRFGPKSVKIFFGKIDLSNKNAVIVDDIVSTGHTIAEIARKLKKANPKRIYLFVIHLILEDAIKLIRRSGVKEIISTNTIPNKTSKIDVSDLIASALKKT